MSKTKKLIILLGILFAFFLFFSVKSHAYCWPVANSSGTIDYKTTYIEYGYGKRVYTVDNSLWKNEGSYSKTENHYGIDITGTPSSTYKIVSTSNGTVLATSANRTSSAGTSFQNNNQRQGSHKSDGGGYGNYVLIQDSSTKMVFLYAHLAPNTIKVKKGDTVSMGQVIGTMGSSGDAGHMHLHFEIRRNASSTLVSPSASKSNLTSTSAFDYSSSSSQTINPVKYIYTYKMAQDFVTDLYKNILGRSPDTSGYNNWVKAMMTGTTQKSIIKSFYNSTEFTNKKYSSSDYVEKLYKGCLQRSSDSYGKLKYTAELSAGYSRNDVLNEFLKSSEFKTLYTSYYARDFVKTAYKKIYGKNPSSSTLKSLMSTTTAANAPSKTLYSIYNSTEFKNKKYSNANYVEKLYNGCLLRSSDSSGKASHINSLTSGSSRNQVLKTFLSSKEYRKLVAKNYGMSNVSI